MKSVQNVNEYEMPWSGYERTFFLKADDGRTHIIYEIFSS